MNEELDDIDLKIEHEDDDLGHEVEIEKKSDPADDSPEAGIESLRRQLEESKQAKEQAEERARIADRAREDERRARQVDVQAREEAERRARQASDEMQSTQRTAYDAQYDSVVNALSAAHGELSGLKAAMKSAMSEGDFDKAAELSADIGVAASRVSQFEAGKVAMERDRQSGRQSQQQNYREDPRESYLRQMPAKTATWLRRNDRFFSDTGFRQMVQGADSLARGRGLIPESDDYFDFIEKQVGLRTDDPAPKREVETPTPATSSPPKMASAPAAGSTPAATKSTPREGTVRLTREERELCQAMEISETAYARQKLAAMASGEITKR